MSITTTSILPPPIAQSFAYRLLAVAVPNMIHNIIAVPYQMPRNGGTTLRMRRYNPLATAVVPIGNSGLTPPAQNLTALDIDAQISFYGTFVILNEQVVLQDHDPVLNESAERLGVSLKQTEDQLTRDVLAATASFVNAVGGTNGDNPTNIARSDIDKVVATLLSANALTLTDTIEGQDKFGTAPVRNAFIALCNTSLTTDLQNVTGFIHNSQYPSPMNAMQSEWGAAGNLRFMVSSIGSAIPTASTNGQTVYNIFCCGMESYAYILQDGYSAQFLYRPPIYSDPKPKVSSRIYFRNDGVVKSSLIDLEAYGAS